MANFGQLAAEIGSVVWGTQANFNGFRVLASILQGTLVVGVSQTLRRWPTFLVSFVNQLECGPMPNVMAALANIGGALCSLVDAHCWSAVQ